MSNYRGGGGGYRDRERPGAYRDNYQDRERDRDWRDRDSRRDTRYDDSRRRYDSHEGLERPLGDPYERSNDRRRPIRDFDRPPPRRYERVDRDFDRPAPGRYGLPPATYDDVPRGPRAARRFTRSPSPPSGPRLDRDVRPPVDYDRQAPRRRSISPSSQSSSSRRPRSPSRRPPSPAPLDREKFRNVSAIKSPLESGEERTDSHMTGQTHSSRSTNSSASLTILGSAAASGLTSSGLTASARPSDARGPPGQRVTSSQSSQAGSPKETTQNISTHSTTAFNTPAVSQTEERADKAAPATFREPVSRNNSPPPAAPAVPTGPRALRDGRAQPWQGPYSRGGGGFGRGRGRGAYSAASSGLGTYAGRPSQRDYREGPFDNNPGYRDGKRNDEEERQLDPWQSDAAVAQSNTRASWLADTPQPPQEADTGVWGESSKSPWQAETRSSPRDVKQTPWATSSPAPATNDKEILPGWGNSSPFVGSAQKEEIIGNNSPGATNWPRRDSRSNIRPPNDISGASPGQWGEQSASRPFDSRRPLDPKEGRSTLGVEQTSAEDPFHRNDPSPAKGTRPLGRYKAWQAEEKANLKEQQAQEKDAELLQQKPWIAHFREADKLRERRDRDLDPPLLHYSAAVRKALRDLEVLEGELTAVNLNRKLRKEHLDKYKETFTGEMGIYGTGDVAMI